MIDIFLCILEEYQSLFVGLIGFSGVIITLYQNARLSRKQHEREKEHERRTLRQSLLSELRILEEILSDRSNTTKKDENRDWLVPAKIPDHVYKTLLPKIGLLNNDEVSSVMKAYVLLDELPQRLGLLSPTANINREDKDYIFVERQHIEMAAGIHKVFLKEIRNALKALEAHENEAL